MALTKDQEELLKLLVRVKEFLDDNGITFYLFGGSCIGAVRHHGFIPWDNDVDIIMDRENYEKLIEASYSMPFDDIEFWSYEKHDDYFKAFGQFSSKKDTYFLKTRVFNRGLCMGTIIDVFVMDYVPSEKLEEHKKNLLLYEEVLGFYRYHRDEISNFKDIYFALIEDEKRRSRRQVVEELQAKVEQFDKEESDLLVTRFWVKKLRQYKKEWFGEPRYCEFEGHMMPIPAQAEATLRQQYGYDWYILPDEDMQMVHDFYVNHDISNNNYVEDMERFIDTNNIVEMLEARKHHIVNRIKSRQIMQSTSNQLLAKRLMLELRHAFISRDFQSLEIVLKRHSEIKGMSISDISEDILYDWILWLIKDGRYYDAVKLPNIFSIEKGCRSYQLLEQIQQLVIAYQDRNYKDMDDALAGFSSDLKSEIPDCILARTLLTLNHISNNEALEELLSLCDSYLLNHPKNYDIMKAKADLLQALSRNDEAAQIYREVASNSRNGMDLLSIQDKL